MCWARDGRLLQAFGGASRLTRIRQVPKSVGVCSCGFVSAHKAGIGIVIVCVIQSYPNRRRVELWRANRVFGPCALPWGLRNKDPPNQFFWFRVRLMFKTNYPSDVVSSPSLLEYLGG